MYNSSGVWSFCFDAEFIVMIEWEKFLKYFLDIGDNSLYVEGLEASEYLRVTAVSFEWSLKSVWRLKVILFRYLYVDWLVLLILFSLRNVGFFVYIYLFV